MWTDEQTTVRVMRTAMLAAALLSLSHPLRAQVLRGRTTDASTGEPVPDVSLSVLSTLGGPALGASTGQDGSFAVDLSSAGAYVVVATRLGYKDAISERLFILDGDTLAIEIEMAPSALEIEGLVVNAESDRGRFRFQRRREAGEGVFVGPERLATLDMAHPGDAFRGLEEEGVRLKWAFGRTGTGSADRIPTIQTNRGNGCVRILLNERPLPIGARHAIDENPWVNWPLNTLRPEEIAGVEVYLYAGEAPEEFRHYALIEHFDALGRFDHDETCGLVIIWTKDHW